VRTSATDNYEAIRQGFQAEAMAHAGAVVAACDQTREQLARHQQHGWEAALAYARAVSPWHAERLAGLGVDAAPADVPTMTKDDLLANFDRIVADPRCSLANCEAQLAAVKDRPCFVDDDYVVVTSGGTSGRRGVFPWTRSGFAGIFLSVSRWALRGPLDGEPPRRVTSVGARSPRHATAAVSMVFGSSGGETSFPVDLSVAEIVAGLNRVQPDLLVVYASMVPILAEESVAGRLTIHPKVVSPTSEPLPPGCREAAVDAWGVELMNAYGTSEAGILASGCCAAAGMHVNEDLLLVEPVDAEGRPVGPGERSAKVLVTPFGAGHALPLIRYELDDEVVPLDEPCPCGSPFWRLAEVTGRADDLLVWGDVTIHPHVVRSVMSAHAGVLEYQVRVMPDGVDVDVRPSGRHHVDPYALHFELRAALTQAGLPDPRVDIHRVAAVARTDMGKLRRFVPLARAS
jgi:phenylacetate-CoA ligase